MLDSPLDDILSKIERRPGESLFSLYARGPYHLATVMHCVKLLERAESILVVRLHKKTILYPRKCSATAHQENVHVPS